MADISRNDPIKLPVHSVGGVLGHFKLAASDASSVMARAIRFAYRFTAKDFEGAIPGQTQKDFHKDIAEYTINIIEFRIELYKAYKDDFFRGFDRAHGDALAIATICAGMAHAMNEPQTPPPPAIPHDNENIASIAFHNDGFDDETVMLACNLWEDADDVVTYGYNKETDYLWPEAHFLAHIQAMEVLCDYESRFDERSPEEHQYFLTRELPSLRSIVQGDTQIGKALSDFIDHIEPRLVKRAISGPSAVPPRLSAPGQKLALPPPERKKPFLFIVPGPEIQ